MKLLFDQNLSYKLCAKLLDLFSGSEQARQIGLDRADDRTIWQYAVANGFTIVTQDSDFADFSGLYGSPPKVIWLRCGNQPTDVVESLLRNHAPAIHAFEHDANSGCLEIY